MNLQDLRESQRRAYSTDPEDRARIAASTTAARKRMHDAWTRAQRIAQLEDILGEASACSDPDCFCKRDAAIAREELEELTLWRSTRHGIAHAYARRQAFSLCGRWARRDTVRRETLNDLRCHACEKVARGEAVPA